MAHGNHITNVTSHSFGPIIEEEEAVCVIRRVDLAGNDDLYCLIKGSNLSSDAAPLSDCARFSSTFTSRFGVFLFNVSQPKPTEPFLADLGLWIKEHRHPYRCPVVVLSPNAPRGAVATLAKEALVLFHRPRLTEDLTAFFNDMMSTDAVIRCDFWDIVTGTRNRDCWELISCTDSSTDADDLQQAGEHLLSSFTDLTTPPAWLLSFSAAPEALTKNPLRPIFRQLATHRKDALMICAVKAEPSCGQGFRVTVLSRITPPSSTAGSTGRPQ